MFKRMSLALVAGASCLGSGPSQANAMEVGLRREPNVIYGDQMPRHPVQVRAAYAQRSNMGGGFIEFLFGDGPPQGGRYQQQPAYQPQPSYEPRGPMLQPIEPQQSTRPQQEATEPGQRPFNPIFEKQVVDYHGKESPGTIVV